MNAGIDTAARGAAGGTAPTWQEVIAHLLLGRDLSMEQGAWAMNETMQGRATPVLLTGFLVALRAKGVSVQEMRALSETMLTHAVPFPAAPEVRALDIVGTGGDRFHTVNVSTMAAIVAAGAGTTVVKHGNRAASSLAGSADVLEAVGVRLDLAPREVSDVALRCGITFCFAAAFHPSMRHAGPTRRELGLPTAFNFLGPLTNPAQPTYSAVGVSAEAMAPVLAGVFAERAKSAVIFRGDDGLDEVTPATTTSLWWVEDGAITTLTADPRRVGFEFSAVEHLRGQDAAYNADVLRSVCGGQGGPIRDAVLLNAGLALALVNAGEGRGPSVHDESDLHQRWADGIDAARNSIDTGRADEMLKAWVTATAEVAG
ncbi:MAG: anthranilate phosphoribosyltransferase [Ornithinimicrobium sp.]